MLVSIVTPIFNRDAVIAETIESVLSQTYPHWELIVVDDGSNDRSAEIVKSYAAKDSRVKLYVREKGKKGGPVCRNIGLDNATGDLLMFLDSDDLLIPETLAYRVKSMKDNPEMDFIVFPSAFFNVAVNDATLCWNKEDERNALDRFLLMDSLWCISGPIWRRSFLSKHRLRFDEGALTAQDWEFHLRALLINPQFFLQNVTPDNFIRRNKSVDTISAKHASYDKVKNRLFLIKNMIQHPIVVEKPDYIEKLLFVLILECLRIFNSQNTVPDEIVRFVNETNTPKFKNIASSVRFFKTSVRLYHLNTIFFKIYRKWKYAHLVNEKVFGSSKYRTPLSEFDKEKIKHFL